MNIDSTISNHPSFIGILFLKNFKRFRAGSIINLSNEYVIKTRKNINLDLEKIDLSKISIDKKLKKNQFQDVIDLTFNSGLKVNLKAFIGNNGAGKTTILNIIHSFLTSLPNSKKSDLIGEIVVAKESFGLYLMGDIILFVKTNTSTLRRGGIKNALLVNSTNANLDNFILDEFEFLKDILTNTLSIFDKSIEVNPIIRVSLMPKGDFDYGYRGNSTNFINLSYVAYFMNKIIELKKTNKKYLLRFEAKYEKSVSDIYRQIGIGITKKTTIGKVIFDYLLTLSIALIEHNPTLSLNKFKVYMFIVYIQFFTNSLYSYKQLFLEKKKPYMRDIEEAGSEEIKSRGKHLLSESKQICKYFLELYSSDQSVTEFLDIAFSSYGGKVAKGSFNSNMDKLLKTIVEYENGNKLNKTTRGREYSNLSMDSIQKAIERIVSEHGVVYKEDYYYKELCYEIDLSDFPSKSFYKKDVNYRLMSKKGRMFEFDLKIISHNKFYIKDLSAGELKMINCFGKIKNFLDKKKIHDGKLVLFFDEPETHLHLEWQRRFIYILLKFITEKFAIDYKIKDIEIFIATHSPLIISNITKDSVVFLQKEKKRSVNESVFYTNILDFDKICKNEQLSIDNTFLGNIPEITQGPFFLDKIYGELGENLIKVVVERGLDKKSYDNLKEICGDEDILRYLLLRNAIGIKKSS